VSITKTIALLFVSILSLTSLMVLRFIPDDRRTGNPDAFSVYMTIRLLVMAWWIVVGIAAVVLIRRRGFISNNEATRKFGFTPDSQVDDRSRER
jgi:hypothetical protein